MTLETLRFAQCEYKFLGKIILKKILFFMYFPSIYYIHSSIFILRRIYKTVAYLGGVLCVKTPKWGLTTIFLFSTLSGYLY